MKRIIFCFFVLLASASLLAFGQTPTPVLPPAADPPKSKAYKVSGLCGLSREYLGQNGANFYDGKFVSCEVTVAWNKSGLYLNLWTSTGFRKENQGDKETDLEFGKVGQIKKKSFGMMNYRLAIARYFVKHKDLAGFTADFSWPREIKNATLTPGIQTAGFIPLGAGGPSKGVFLHLYLKGTIPLNSNWTFVERTRLTFGSSAFGFKPGNVFRQDFELRRKLSGHFTLGGGLAMSSPLRPPGDGRKTEIVPKLSIYFQ